MSTNWLNYDVDDDQDDNQRALAKIMSPVPAAQLVPPMASLDRGNYDPRTPASIDRQNYDPRTAATITPAVSRTAAPMQGTSNPPSDPILTSSAQQPASTLNLGPSTIGGMNPDPTASLRPGGTNPQAQPGALTAAMSSMPNPQANVTGPLQPAQSAGQLQPASKGGFWRGLGRVADVAGSIIDPALTARVPGSTLYNQRQVGIQQARAKGAADINDTNQLAAQRGAKAQQDLADASRDALRNPTAKEAQLYNLDPEAQYRPTELGRLAIEANKGHKPDSIQGMYASAVQDALDRGTDPMKDPKVQSLADAQTSIQRAPATKAEQRDDRAISILSKPPGQRSAEENSYLGGYQQWNKLTKVDPGMARMSVLLQQPIAAADPNNPGGEVYVSKKNAVGMGAPGGVGTTAPKALVKDFTSGPDAKTLTNINTADAHIQQLGQIAKALHNGDIKGINQLSNMYKEQTGNPAPINFQLLKTALSAEIAKTTTGGTATVEETKEISKAINAANSPAQLAGVIQQASALMHSKRSQLQDQFQQGMRGQPNFGTNGPAPSGRAVSLAAARSLPQNKGKSDADITKDIESHGHKVVP